MTAVAVAGVTRTARVIISIIVPRRIDLRDVCSVSHPFAFLPDLSRQDTGGPILSVLQFAPL